MMPVSELAAQIVPFKAQDDRELNQDIAVSVARTTSLVVTDDLTLHQAGEYLKGYADLIKRIDAWFKEDIARAFALHRSLTGKRKKALDAIDGEVARLKGSLASYVNARELARRRQEIEAQAEAQRLEDERIQREAKHLEDTGQADLAEAVLNEHLAAPPVTVVLPAAPRLEGVSTVEAWTFEVVSEALIPRAYLTVDEPKIRSVVRALKGATRIPGIRVVRSDQVRVRA